MRTFVARHLLRALLAAALTVLPPVAVFAAPPAPKPNVIFLLADDLGWSDLRCYGHPYARTPNLDRLATEGTRFQNCYATGVTCCPARTGWMTGKLPATFATYPAYGGFGERTTVTEVLKKQGYVTGHFGKWHIGPDEKSGVYGIDVVNASDESRGGKKKDPRGRDAHIYDDAIEFIEKHRGTPFYVNVWGHISHHPITPPEAYVERFGDLRVDETKFSDLMQEKFANCRLRGGAVDEHLRRYLADVASLDEDVGRLLRRLDELALRQNTIVVFSSYQGPAPLAAEAKQKKGKGDDDELRLSAMGYTGPFRGGKHGMYEGGVRVPLIVRWPGRVPAGRVDATSVLSGTDWLPTLASVVGVRSDVPAGDGEDVLSAWLGKPYRRSAPLFWKTSSPGSEAGIRQGDWKLIYPTRKRGAVELYQVADDPAETRNVSSQHPQVVAELSARVEAWVATLPTAYLKSPDDATE